MTPPPPPCPICQRADLARNVAEALADPDAALLAAPVAAPSAGGVADWREIPARSIARWRAVLPPPPPPRLPDLPRGPDAGEIGPIPRAAFLAFGVVALTALVYSIIALATPRPSGSPPSLTALVAVALSVACGAAWGVELVTGRKRRQGRRAARAARRATIAAAARAAMVDYAARRRRHARLAGRYRRLRYCARCDRVFLPGEALAVEPEGAAVAFLADAPDPAEPEPPWWLPEYVRWDVTVLDVPWEARSRAEEAVALILWCDVDEAARQLATLPAAILRDAPAEEAGPMAHWLREAGATVEATPARPARLAER